MLNVSDLRLLISSLVRYKVGGGISPGSIWELVTIL